jgi:hypothetical protein
MWAIHDTDTARAMECESCLAVHWVTKGKPKDPYGVAPWWYHGAQQLDTDDSPGHRINGDGVRSVAPIPFAKWYALSTEAEA